MRILILYGSNSGGTDDVAHRVGAVLSRHHHDISITPVSAVRPEHLVNYDVVILGSCTWLLVTDHHALDGQLQEEFAAFAGSLLHHRFPNTRFAIFSLGDNRFTKFCAAADHLEALVRSVEGRKIGDTLRVDQYFFSLPENRRIVDRWAERLARLLEQESAAEPVARRP